MVPVWPGLFRGISYLIITAHVPGGKFIRLCLRYPNVVGLEEVVVKVLLVLLGSRNDYCNEGSYII